MLTGQVPKGFGEQIFMSYFGLLKFMNCKPFIGALKSLEALEVSGNYLSGQLIEFSGESLVVVISCSAW